MTADQRNRLREPLDPSQLQSSPGRGGNTFFYVDARDLLDRLDDVLGPTGYSIEHDPVVMDEDAATVKTRLTLHLEGRDVVKEEFGQAIRKEYRDRNTGDMKKDKDAELYKNAATDGIRRVCVTLDVCACRSLYFLKSGGAIGVRDGRYVAADRAGRRQAPRQQTPSQQAPRRQAPPAQASGNGGGNIMDRKECFGGKHKGKTWRGDDEAREYFARKFAAREFAGETAPHPPMND